MSVFIELGVPIIVKQVNRWVITCCVVSPWGGMAYRKEFVSMEICKKEEEESSGQ